ncbi:MAG: hypothetical protein ACTHL8_05110 [Burkholderiaceae bacterium]
MAWTVEHSGEPRASFGHWVYIVRRDGEAVARYRHDYRGEPVDMRFLDGRLVPPPPAGTVIQPVLEGGGPEPLRLSAVAVGWLEAQMRR